MAMLAPRWNDPDRLKAALAAALVQVLLGYALLMGLAMHLPPAVRDELKVFGVAPPPPPPREVPEPRHSVSHKKEGAAAPAALRAKASEVVAPPPPIVMPVPPPPVVAAPKPFQGNQASQGAAPVPGPGTGAGGLGNGTGSGGAGDGEGAGGETPLVHIKGRIYDADYPREAPQDDQVRIVYLRFTVGTNGRVTDCGVTRSSGSAALDATTCRLILQRFRYRPSLDSAGRPIADTVTGEQRWNVSRGAPDDEEDRP